MADSGRIAIATLVMRNKEYLVAVRPDDDALALHTMYFSDEVRQPGREFPALPNTDEVSDRELSMAQLLIESMESDWDPKRFHDTHREKVEEIIEEKRSGHEIVLQAEPEAAGQGGRPDGGPQRQHQGLGPVGRGQAGPEVGRQADTGQGDQEGAGGQEDRLGQAGGSPQGLLTPARPGPAPAQM